MLTSDAAIDALRRIGEKHFDEWVLEYSESSDEEEYVVEVINQETPEQKVEKYAYVAPGHCYYNELELDGDGDIVTQHSYEVELP